VWLWHPQETAANEWLWQPFQDATMTGLATSGTGWLAAALAAITATGAAAKSPNIERRDIVISASQERQDQLGLSDDIADGCARHSLCGGDPHGF
jgi:hypothetical protein